MAEANSIVRKQEDRQVEDAETDRFHVYFL